MSTYPTTEREPVTDTLHGESIEDPYRWLEGDDDRVDEWEQRQNEYTETVIQTDRRASLEPAFEELGWRENYFLPTVRGGRYFQRIEPAEAEQPRLTVRDEPDGDPRTLVDPTDLDETVSLQWFEPNWDGTLVVYGLMDAGTEQYDLRVLDVDARDVVDSIDDVGRCNGASWDDRGFYYSATGAADEGGQLDKQLRYHELDGEDRLVTADFDPERWPAVQVGPESGVVLVTVGELGTDSELFALDDGDLKPVLTDLDAPLTPTLQEGRVYVHTTAGAPRGRVLAHDAATVADASELDDFDTVVPESADTIQQLAPVGDGVAIHRIRDASSVVSLHEADGTERYELSLPEFAGIPRGGLGSNRESAELFCFLQGLDRPTSIIHAETGPDAGPDGWAVLQSPTLPEALDPQQGLDLTVERRWVESTDAASVPVYVVHRSDIDLDGDAPAVLYGYGGFRIPLLPSLDPYRLPFLRDGGVFALACLRGGSEFGEEWHEQGAREHKEHTFDDFEAVAEDLVEAGYTSADRLAGWGGSNGGLTVGAALTRRPDLFGALVCSVPLLDMLRFHTFLLGQAWTGEYGSPEDEAAFEWLRSYSPYHNVKQRPYPATLFATAAGDTRVHPSHARKMTARLQEATTGEDPICYHSVEETGHGTGTPTSLEIEQTLDKWAFVYETLDVSSDTGS
ncbi:prolyl oligopeptidase [Halovenus aranensis]|uniref:prolyl oligopeptidase n=1 Tax=Halovenus aranensis TaxID=890420 RepID=A0A1G8WK83_9EURY|nr:prolyl oligopeptidase family serine peptidase [Halovenus aranensis]SDJ78762.1 prolyl oligopeptidase [Halovenus aranensis]